MGIEAKKRYYRNWETWNLSSSTKVNAVLMLKNSEHHNFYKKKTKGTKEKGTKKKKR